VGGLVSVPGVGLCVSGGGPPGGPLRAARRFGPPGLAVYCLLNLLMASEGALTFSAAEVNLLFPAPLSRRQLLAYKLAVICGTSLLTAAVLTLFLGRFTANPLAGFVGLLLTAVFLQLLPMTLALVASAVGVRAYNRHRKILLGVLLVGAAAALLPYAGQLLGPDRGRVLGELERSPAAQAVLTPFRWFVEAFTAERVWPDLLQYAGLGLLID